MISKFWVIWENPTLSCTSLTRKIKGNKAKSCASYFEKLFIYVWTSLISEHRNWAWWYSLAELKLTLFDYNMFCISNVYMFANGAVKNNKAFSHWMSCLLNVLVHIFSAKKWKIQLISKQYIRLALICSKVTWAAEKLFLLHLYKMLCGSRFVSDLWTLT